MKKKPPTKRPTRSDRQTRRPTSWWRRLGRLVVGLGLLGLVSASTTLAVYAHMAKRYDLDELGKMPERTVVFDRRGRALGRLDGEDRIVVPLDEVSPWFIKALLVREDRRFYQHGGVDFVGVLRATMRNLQDRRVVQGASTLTMQLARNSYPDLNDRSFHRKLIEMMLARRIEKAVGKDQIIEHYVNRIFFGPGLWGIQRASQVYFGKHAAQLSLSEAALIAGIIRGPSKFSPFRNLTGAIRERDVVLRQMKELGVITPQEELAARYEEVVLRAQPAFQNQGGYALDAVKRELDLILEQEDILDGGLEVLTSIDLDLQTAASDAVERQLRAIENSVGYAHPTKKTFDESWNQISQSVETPYLQGAVTLIDNATGGVLAIVGGRDYRHSKFNRASQGSRQVGSVVKPFVYAAGLTSGLLPGSWVDDSPLVPGEIDGAAAHWNPSNSDGQFLGLQPMFVGLVQSRNAMSVRIGDRAGLDRVMQMLREAGLGARMERTPQIYIGNLAANSYQMAVATSIFPNDGIRRRPRLVERVTDRAGHVLFAAPTDSTEVMGSGAAHLMRRMLHQSLESAAGAALADELRVSLWSGGKTGTTNDYKDAWFAGYSGSVTAAVWIGLDQPAPILEEGYGARLALPVWLDTMKEVARFIGSDAVPRPAPASARVALCRGSGDLATAACHAKGMAYEDDLPYELLPNGFCAQHGELGGGSVEPPPRGDGWWSRLKHWLTH